MAHIDQYRLQAKKEVTTSSAEIKKNIEDNDDLTAEENEVWIEEVGAKLKKATEDIDATNTVAEVIKAKTDGLSAIKAITVTPRVKPDAKKAIKIAEDIKKIENIFGLKVDVSDKFAKFCQFLSKAKNAEKAIDKATTNAEVAAVREFSIGIIEDGGISWRLGCLVSCSVLFALLIILGLFFIHYYYNERDTSSLKFLDLGLGDLFKLPNILDLFDISSLLFFLTIAISIFSGCIVYKKSIYKYRKQTYSVEQHDLKDMWNNIYESNNNSN